MADQGPDVASPNRNPLAIEPRPERDRVLAGETDPILEPGYGKRFPGRHGLGHPPSELLELESWKTKTIDSRNLAATFEDHEHTTETNAIRTDPGQELGLAQRGKPCRGYGLEHAPCERVVDVRSRLLERRGTDATVLADERLRREALLKSDGSNSIEGQRGGLSTALFRVCLLR
jgi:hypothetical protein